MLVIRELFSEGDEAVSEIICFCVHLLMGVFRLSICCFISFLIRRARVDDSSPDHSEP